ncbi:helix-turn-helix domain-containing protein [Kribbella yunnanensis]|uniref:Helix-turn-helix domain-containing protein n=1 Tax=Kribbella yunnanensis TaxID=190194 RepID=A0ABN2IV97_9ACTN
MSDELQRVVDSLAGRLGRSVAVDDTSFRLLAYSAQVGAIDDMRARVILTREAPPEGLAWLRRFRLGQASGPVHLPSDAELGLLPRVAIPVRHQGVQFGYLWLIDTDGSLAADDLTAATTAADEAGEVLFRERVIDELRDARVGELVRDLLSPDAATQQMAADGLIEGGFSASRGGVVAIVVQPLPVAGQEVDEGDRLALSAALHSIRNTLPPRECLILVRPHHVVLILPQSTYERFPRVAHDLRTAAEARLGVSDRWRAVVSGVGRKTQRLAEAKMSYGQALAAIRVADVVPAFRPVASHDALGIYGLLASQPADQLHALDVLPAIDALQSPDPALLVTAELFLDRAGDARLVAEQLDLHRTSVYHRLRRIEQLTGFDLSDGEQRLVLHLGIKVARLLGRV